MAKTWKQILSELGRVPLSQTERDKEEMLMEKGMTWIEFTKTDEWKEMAIRGMRARFNDPVAFPETDE